MSMASTKVNDEHDTEKQQSPQKRSAIRALVQDFEPIWFTKCMNAGVIGIIMNRFPYQSHWIHVCSTIAYMINLILITLFSTIIISRFITFPRQAWSEITESPKNLSLLATWPIAWLTLSCLTSLCVSRAYWGHHAFTIVAYVMWWIGVAWTIATVFFILIILIRRQKGQLSDVSWIPPTIVMPCVALATAALTGGLIASYSYHISARMAVPMIIVAFIMAGMAIFIGLLLFTFLFYQLLVTGFPEGPQSAMLFLYVGPMAQSAAALQALGSAASSFGAFGGYHRGTFLQQSAASSLNAACVLLALLLFGLATTWLILASYGMIEQTFMKKMKWAPTWNSIVFPCGTYTTACLQFSIEMDSPAWRALTAAGLIIIVILFLTNTVMTTIGVAKGEEMIVKEDPRQQKSE